MHAHLLHQAEHVVEQVLFDVRSYGQEPERMFAPVVEAARQAGIPLDFSKVVRVYSTVSAHTLVRHAEEKGTGRALVAVS